MSDPGAIAITPEFVTSTLTDPILNGQIYQTYISSITANWTPIATGLGYRLEVSTAQDFSTTAASSGTPNVSLSTLTVVGLVSNTTYYLRVSGLDPMGTYNWLILGSTVTATGTAPTNPAIVAVASSTIHVRLDQSGRLHGL